jgi:antitoxin component of MazEF toxin-antitoxin module
MGWDNTITALENGKETDITPIELQAIAKFKEDGMPGLITVAQNEVTLTKALDLYLSGKTYHEISKIVNIKKEIILYLGQKFNWYATKIEQLQILDACIKERILQAKLVNQDFVLQIQQFFLKKIGRRMTRFMASGDEETANSIDRKDLEMYMKSVDLLDKISTEKIPTNYRPTVGLNLGDGVTVRKVGENEVTITPRNKTAAEMLNELANLKRTEEAKSANDINNKETQTNSENTEKEKE